MKKVEFLFLIFIGLVILFAGTYHPEGTETATITVGGMKCNNCAEHIQKALMKVQGVSGAVVDLKAGTAVVTYNPADVKIEDLRTAITTHGFSADDQPAASDHCEIEKGKEMKHNCGKEKGTSMKKCSSKKDKKEKGSI